jgi:hypothetical protein
VAGQDGGGELAGGIISGGSGVEAGGVTMMPAGGEGAVSAAGGGCGSVSAQRRSAEKRQPSATAPTTVISLFIQPISLRPVPLYSDPADAAREPHTALLGRHRKDVLCLAHFHGGREKDLWTAPKAQVIHDDLPC